MNLIQPEALKTLAILVVDDDDVDREKIVRLLSKTSGEYQVSAVTTASEAMNLMSLQQFDCALVDYRLQESLGSELARQMVDAAVVPFPVIMVSGNSDEKIVADVMRDGVFDYLPKRNLKAEDLQHALEKALAWAKREAQFKESHARFTQLAEGLPQLAWTCLPDGRCDFLNRRWCEYTGISGAEQLDFGWLQYVHPDDQDRVISTWLKAVETASEMFVYFRLRRHDGEYRWFDTRATPQRNDAGEIVRWLGTNTDITEFELTRQALQDSEQKFHTAFEYAPLGMAMVSLSGDILQANAALKKILGFDSCEPDRRQNSLILTSIRQLTYPDDINLEAEKLRELRRNKQPYIQYEKRYLGRDNSPIYTLTSVALIKPNNEVPCYLYQIHDLSDRKRYEAKLIEMSRLDPLTGLGNRVKLQVDIDSAIHTAMRLGTPFALLFLDLDNFKQINDSLGHEAGDQLLKIVAQRLQKFLRKDDSVTRLGGDEFVIVLQDTSSIDAVVKVAEGLIQKIKSPIQLDNTRVHIAMSLGIALYPSHGTDAKTLLRNADSALYDAKSKGRSCFQMYRTELTHSANHRLLLDSDLRNAIINEEFEIYYQPVVNLLTGRVESVEALLRWNHPERGLVMPDDFIPYAQESGLICQIGDWVLQQACLHAAAWNASGFNIAVGVNVSARQFHQHNLVECIAKFLQEAKLPADKLIIEITEQMFLENTETNLNQVFALKNQGVQISLDDFGTGYSSLSYIIRFAPNFLKIDRSFVQKIGHAQEHDNMVAAIIGLSKVIPMKIVAEGVETADQQVFLLQSECNFVQGYLYSHPVTFLQLMGLLRCDHDGQQLMH